MAWNKYYIFIQSPGGDNMSEILQRLKLGNFKPIREVSLHESNKPQTLFAGFYNNNLLIVHPELPFHFFGPKQTETEKLFIEAFPGCEIAALIENSTVGLYSYAVISGGKKIRMKDGADGEIYNNAGDPLPEEKAILGEKIFEDEEIEEMKEDGLEQEEIEAMIAHEASWRVPNRLTKRYLGEEVSVIDTDKVKLTMYEL